jgi:hypothetical protein
MSTVDKLPKAFITKQSLNAEIVDSYSRYTQGVMTVLSWLEKFEYKKLKRIERLTDEADGQGNEMTPGYQFSVYIKVSELVLKLEEVRLKFMDKLQGIDLPSAPALNNSAQQIHPEIKRLCEMFLVAKEKYGVSANILMQATIDLLESGELEDRLETREGRIFLKDKPVSEIEAQS